MIASPKQLSQDHLSLQSLRFNSNFFRFSPPTLAGTRKRHVTSERLSESSLSLDGTTPHFFGFLRGNSTTSGQVLAHLKISILIEHATVQTVVLKILTPIIRIFPDYDNFLAESALRPGLDCFLSGSGEHERHEFAMSGYQISFAIGRWGL
ncbi:hypothetical protein K443DRAFT_178343 [Laccaria amethystina LaAM-08-1]|uniref:Uncharacterized protein n=1 Tax=Laccaria amethystina LaAM-08-1 TaxID=1095629 RepID=A0A0C9XNW6_9AGAR|nr:hypothetical protein K443DRAFT_178343 [Laccaria amethystina LaAM-08-1]